VGKTLIVQRMRNTLVFLKSAVGQLVDSKPKCLLESVCQGQCLWESFNHSFAPKWARQEAVKQESPATAQARRVRVSTTLKANYADLKSRLAQKACSLAELGDGSMSVKASTPNCRGKT